MHRQKKYRAVTPGVAWVLAGLQIDSPYGRAALQALRPARAKDLASLEQNFAELARVVGLARHDSGFFARPGSLFKRLRYIGGSLDNLEAGLVLDETELLEIKGFSLLLTDLKHWYDASGLGLASIDFAEIGAVLRILNPDSTLVASFHIHDAYSERLKEIRATKKLLENAILQCQDLPRREELRRERLEIVHQERDEESVVRAGLGERLRPWVPRLRLNGELAGQLELLLAKAHTAVEHACCRPELLPADCRASLLAENMINPEVAEVLLNKGHNFTPVSIELINGTTLLTGANMGGKTVALLTLAMNAELASLGFFVFASRFRMPLFDFICLMAGDGQNQASGLSSFGAEIIRLTELTAQVRSGVGLAVCDEFARSTNPSEGRRFVQALGEFLQHSGSYGIIATHYDGINIAGAACWQVVGLKNRSLHAGGGDQNEVLGRLCANMDYRLKKLAGDYEVPQEALHIAKILEVDPEFMAILRGYYPPEDK